ncbi:MAG: type II CAAX endopeptidase family protein [Syntrophomonas sp.]|nr:type II CAAX endopeptidase family protein [Syntrophomonas sp.]
MTDRPRWGLLDIILVYTAIMTIGVLMSIWGTKLSDLFPAQLVSREMAGFITGVAVQFLATIGFVYLFAVLFPRGQWKDLGFKRARPGSYVRYGIMGGMLLLAMVMVIGILLKYWQPDIEPQYYEKMLRSALTMPELALILIAGAVLAPLSEEVFYRGMIYPVFRKYLGPVWGAVIAGLIFGLAHWDLWRAIPLALGGMGLCYIYEKSGSIMVAVLAHGVWNGVLSLLIFLTLSQKMI